MLFPPPHPNLPPSIKIDYLEAKAIATDSPRGAAALLRIAVEKICLKFGCKGKTLSDKIGELIQKKSAPSIAQEALDSLRIKANQNVHPGSLDSEPTKLEDTIILFKLLNIIGEKIYYDHQLVTKIYYSNSEINIQNIKKRDSQDTPD